MKQNVKFTRTSHFYPSLNTPGNLIFVHGNSDYPELFFILCREVVCGHRYESSKYKVQMGVHP